ncbi:MAG: hypothetical protein HQ478_15505 [Chloroflexi bacterium]|nr:hypothetical protein [Chloroflexota bacterium]
MMNWKSLYKLALRILIGSVAISAVLGIVALLLRDLDDFTGRTLGTTLFVSAAALLIMANTVVMESKQRGYFYVSGLGLVMALVALPLFLTALWMDQAPENLWKTGVSIEIVSIVMAHSSILSLRRLPKKYEWTMPLATVLAMALGSLVVGMIWIEDAGSSTWRYAGTLAILVTSITIVIPVIPRLVALEMEGGESSVNRSIHQVRHCPDCGIGLADASDSGRETTCHSCGAVFSVEFSGQSS